MTNVNAESANNPGLPAECMERLALFAEWTNTTPPERIVYSKGKDQTFSDEIIMYAHTTGMSLDWFWLGDERGLVMAAHNQAREALQ
ncbi:hypothetical protein [Shimia sediminis]|uniref:hypothetical protein n=1 Tax=Shimia sediminis TaxID=2497945 RepID=UPI000F8E2C7F|nr:hypothetical protein [Shimia sediminis]